MPPEDDDPVIASYDVYIATSEHASVPNNAPSATIKPQPKLYILQYPSHRPNSKPYSTTRFQKPSSLRLKAQAGMLELNVPLLTNENYNVPLGSQFGKAMHESKLNHPTTSHGLAGGFATHTAATAHPVNLNDVPDHQMIDMSLHTQTLGGKISTSTERDPVYMLASLNRATMEISLRHLDALVQLRPQLHHIDAAEEQKRRVESAAKTIRPDTGARGATVDGAPPKLETKAIEMKLKDSSKDDPKDRNLNINARLLREIQNDPWQHFEWVEKGEDGYNDEVTAVGTSGATSGKNKTRKLRSALDNDEWLNQMSSPGIELRTRLKGRDRERARRKRQERARAAKIAGGESAVSATGPFEQEESGTESSGSDEQVVGDNDDVREQSAGANARAVAAAPAPQPKQRRQSAAQRPMSPEMQIKQEGGGAPAVGSTPAAVSPTTPRKRGRPKKTT